MNSNRSYLWIAVTAILIFGFSAYAQTPRTYTAEEEARAEKMFSDANAVMEADKPAEALAKYKELLNLFPDEMGAMYNGGLAAFQSKDFDQALTLWKRLKQLDADDWQVRAKLIQTYQNLGKIPERDAERRELIELRKSGKIDELKEAEYYVREQSELGGRSVMVFEHFDMVGPRGVKFVFYILDNEGGIDYRISLGSYDTTNAIWREIEKRKPDERLFHLDGYFKNGAHATYGMYPKEPNYDETREIVKNILEKKSKPISATIPAAPPKAPPAKPVN